MRIAVYRFKMLKMVTVDFNQELQNPANSLLSDPAHCTPTSLEYAPVNPKITNRFGRTKSEASTTIRLGKGAAELPGWIR